MLVVILHARIEQISKYFRDDDSLLLTVRENSYKHTRGNLVEWGWDQGIQ